MLPMHRMADLLEHLGFVVGTMLVGFGLVQYYAHALGSGLADGLVFFSPGRGSPPFPVALVTLGGLIMLVTFGLMLESVLHPRLPHHSR